MTDTVSPTAKSLRSSPSPVYVQSLDAIPGRSVEHGDADANMLVQDAVNGVRADEAAAAVNNNAPKP